MRAKSTYSGATPAMFLGNTNRFVPFCVDAWLRFLDILRPCCSGKQWSCWMMVWRSAGSALRISRCPGRSFWVAVSLKTKLWLTTSQCLVEVQGGVVREDIWYYTIVLNKRGLGWIWYSNCKDIKLLDKRGKQWSNGWGFMPNRTQIPWFPGQKWPITTGLDLRNHQVYHIEEDMARILAAQSWVILWCGIPCPYNHDQILILWDPIHRTFNTYVYLIVYIYTWSTICMRRRQWYKYIHMCICI